MVRKSGRSVASPEPMAAEVRKTQHHCNPPEPAKIPAQRLQPGVPASPCLESHWHLTEEGWKKLEALGLLTDLEKKSGTADIEDDEDV